MPNNAYDRYVTWGLDVPEGVAIPSLNQWGMPVWFPDPDTYFPKNVVPMYAIRNPSDGQALSVDFSQSYPAPAGVWFIWTPGSGYGMVDDAYFYGGTPDTSGGTKYPEDAQPPEVDPNPPPWVGDPTPPGPQDAPASQDALQPTDEAAQAPAAPEETTT